MVFISETSLNLEMLNYRVCEVPYRSIAIILKLRRSSAIDISRTLRYQFKNRFELRRTTILFLLPVTNFSVNSQLARIDGTPKGNLTTVAYTISQG